MFQYDFKILGECRFGLCDVGTFWSSGSYLIRNKPFVLRIFDRLQIAETFTKIVRALKFDHETLQRYFIGYMEYEEN